MAMIITEIIIHYREAGQHTCGNKNKEALNLIKISLAFNPKASITIKAGLLAYPFFRVFPSRRGETVTIGDRKNITWAYSCGNSSGFEPDSLFTRHGKSGSGTESM